MSNLDKAVRRAFAISPDNRRDARMLALMSDDEVRDMIAKRWDTEPLVMTAIRQQLEYLQNLDFCRDTIKHHAEENLQRITRDVETGEILKVETLSIEAAPISRIPSHIVIEPKVHKLPHVGCDP